MPFDYQSVYNTYLPKLNKMFSKNLKDKDSVEDLSQETLLKVWKHRDKYDEGKALSTWVYTIAFNVLSDYFRADKNNITYKPELYDNEHTESKTNPLDILVSAQMEQQYEDTVSQLDDKYLNVYIAREIEGLSTSETAKELSISESCVKQRLKRVKDALKEVLV